jgi:SSS family solute:Na+ symporter
LDQARWGAMFAVVLKILPVFIFALPGVIALALFPGRESKTTFVTLLNELLPTGARGLVLAALFASLISSTLAVMNSVSTLVVRDFILHFRPNTGERAQVRLGRLAIAVGALLGVVAAYAIYKTPEGLYKYLQALSLYLTLPVAPAIVFGILCKRVTLAGALASVFVGSVFSLLFVIDQFVGPQVGSRLFPLMHISPLTLNYTYRGLWASIASVIVLFAVSAFTKKTDPDTLDRFTVNWRGLMERFRGITDWRLQLAVLTAITFALYWVLA